jgi:hypothetical protein
MYHIKRFVLATVLFTFVTTFAQTAQASNLLKVSGGETTPLSSHKTDSYGSAAPTVILVRVIPVFLEPEALTQDLSKRHSYKSGTVT